MYVNIGINKFFAIHPKNARTPDRKIPSNQ